MEPKDLKGKSFLTFSDKGLHCQGDIIKVVSDPFESTAVVQLYSWITGEPTEQSEWDADAMLEDVDDEMVLLFDSPEERNEYYEEHLAY